MSVSSRTIAKNTSVLMFSQLVTWGFSFILSILLSRYLGPTGIGQLALANSLWMIVGVIAALGTDLLIIKEVARSPDRMNELVGTTLILRLLMFLLGTLGIGIYIRFAGYSPETVTVIWITGVAYLILQLSGTYDATLKGLERMEFTAVAGMTAIVILFLLRTGLLISKFGVNAIAAAAIISNFASLSVLYYFLRSRYFVRLSINWGFMTPLIKVSLPFFLVYIGINLYHQVDKVVISLLADEANVGWYGVADSLYGSLLFIPNVFVTALFPALSRAQKENPSASQSLAKKSLNLLVLVSVPIGWGMTVIANQLVVLLYGESFTNSGPVLAVRGVFLVFTYINMMLGFLLIALDRQKAWAYVILIACIATIPLDLVLVPLTMKLFANGALGGALSFVFTEIGQMIAGLALLPKGYFGWESGKPVGKLILAGFVMVGATWLWRDSFLLIPIVVGAVSYAAMIVILRPLPKEDWAFVLNTLNSMIRRILKRFYRTAELKG